MAVTNFFLEQLESQGMDNFHWISMMDTWKHPITQNV